MNATSRDRMLAYQRVLRRARDLGVSEQNIAQVVHALRDGTTPDELEQALFQYVPDVTFREDDRPLRELGRNAGRPGRRHALAA